MTFSSKILTNGKSLVNISDFRVTRKCAEDISPNWGTQFGTIFFPYNASANSTLYTARHHRHLVFSNVSLTLSYVWSDQKLDAEIQYWRTKPLFAGMAEKWITYNSFICRCSRAVHLALCFVKLHLSTSLGLARSVLIYKDAKQLWVRSSDTDPVFKDKLAWPCHFTERNLYLQFCINIQAGAQDL